MSVISNPLSTMTQTLMEELWTGTSWRLMRQQFYPVESEHEGNFMREQKSWIWPSLHLEQLPFQLQNPVLCDQPEHLEQIGCFALSFLTISCFILPVADLKTGQSFIRLEIPSWPALVLYLWAALLQTGHVLSASWLMTAAFLGFWHLPEWFLWHEEHLCGLSPSEERAALMDSFVSIFLAIWAFFSR